MSMYTEKPIHTIVLDAGPIIKNEPSVSSLLIQAESLVTTPAVISEIRDVTARSRVETTLLPFLTLREPRPTSVRFITDFARKTGDLPVLSRPDVQILALAYELEIERNGGDWRLRNLPGQKRTNGPAPAKQAEETSQKSKEADSQVQQDSTENSELQQPAAASGEIRSTSDLAGGVSLDATEDVAQVVPEELEQNTPLNSTQQTELEDTDVSDPREDLVDDLASVHISTTSEANENDQPPVSRLEDLDQDVLEQDASEDSDSEGWITPSNIKKQQAKDANSSIAQAPEPKTMQVATITTDFAMQNVLLQVNLNLLSTSFQRVRHIKTFILRCHACFGTTKDMTKQFCPRCGGPTLTRVSCSTNQNGEFKMHLKKNMQWNTRGDRYSIPKPVSGSASGKLNVGGGGKGGGKGGWGQSLILAEDQKEYTRAVDQQKRQKQRDLMDEDYLPSILTGERNRTGGRPKVGAGRTVNSRKR